MSVEHFESPEFERQREQMVREQIEARGVRAPRVLAAMRAVPRHRFVGRDYQPQAYLDGPLPIASGQTISQPYMVAVMSELLNLQGDERVLEIGAGSGYQAAVLGLLAGEVHTVERHAGLAKHAQQLLHELGCSNVFVHHGDGSRGLAEFAPYAAIVVTAASPAPPPALLEQLGEGGRLVIPVGSRSGQVLERWQRQGQSFTPERFFAVAFVPLIGDFGWDG